MSIFNKRLRCEQLEEKAMLAVISVTTDQDVVDATDGLKSLREAIAEANATPLTDDLIEFDFSSLPPATERTIALTQGELTITSPLTIDGSGVNNDLGWENLTIDAGGNSRIFSVQIVGGNAQSVTITDLSLTGGSENSCGQSATCLAPLL